jgi:hypothetical protein
LKAWLPSSDWLSSSWMTFFSPTTRQLYRATDNNYDLHSKTLGPSTRSTPQCITFHLDPHDHDATTLPTDAVPIDLETTINSKICRPHRKLFSKADVEAGITDTLQLLQLNLCFQHVHSHPEQHHPNAPLSWDKTLNTRCDKLATHHLEAATMAKPLVPFIPASKVHLQVNGTTITHHIPSQLHYLCSVQATKHYLCH